MNDRQDVLPIQTVTDSNEKKGGKSIYQYTLLLYTTKKTQEHTHTSSASRVIHIFLQTVRNVLLYLEARQIHNLKVLERARSVTTLDSLRDDHTNSRDDHKGKGSIAEIRSRFYRGSSALENSQSEKRILPLRKWPSTWQSRSY